MSIEENKALIRRFFEECWNRKNLEIADDLFAADHVFHGTEGEVPDAGPERVKQMIAELIAAFSDLRFDAEEPMIAEGDMIAYRWAITGTHNGWFSGIAPTNKEIKMTGISIERIMDGKIQETWDSTDRLGLLQQLGVITK